MQFKNYRPKGNAIEAAVADAVGGLPNGGGIYGPGQVVIRHKAVDKRFTAENGALVHKDVDTFEYEIVEAERFLRDFEEVKGEPEPTEGVVAEPAKAPEVVNPAAVASTEEAVKG